MDQRLGSCSICGGDVMGHQGAYWSITPPPTPRCVGCGATTSADVIEMQPKNTQELESTVNEKDNIKDLGDAFLDALTILNLPSDLQDYADERLKQGATTQQVLKEIFGLAKGSK